MKEITEKHPNVKHWADSVQFMLREMSEEKPVQDRESVDFRVWKGLVSDVHEVLERKLRRVLDEKFYVIQAIENLNMEGSDSMGLEPVLEGFS